MRIDRRSSARVVGDRPIARLSSLCHARIAQAFCGRPDSACTTRVRSCAMVAPAEVMMIADKRLGVMCTLAALAGVARGEVRATDATVEGDRARWEKLARQVRDTP